MKIFINYPTGNHFPDGAPEVGRVDPFEVITRADLDRALDTIPDGEYSRAFITDENGEPVALGDLAAMLD